MLTPREIWAQAGNNLIDAVQLDLGGRMNFPNVNAYTVEPNEPAGNGSRTVWFRWNTNDTPADEVMLSTYGSNYDTIINVFELPTGAPPLFTATTPTALGTTSSLSANYVTYTQDDTLLGGAVVTGNAVLTNPQPNKVYLFCVGRNAGGGTNALEITFGARKDSVGTATILNDALASATEFVNTTLGTNQLALNTMADGTTIGSSAETNENSPTGDTTIAGGSVWHKYTVGAMAHVFTVAMENVPVGAQGGTDVIMQVYSNAAANVSDPALLTFVAESRIDGINAQPRVVVSGTATTTYYIRVSSTDGDGFPFSIVLDAAPAQTAPLNDLVDASLTTSFTLAATLPSIRDAEDNNYSATDTETAGNTSGANVWFSRKAPATGLVALRSILPNGIYAVPNGSYAEASTFRFDCDVSYDLSDPTNLASPAT